MPSPVKIEYTRLAERELVKLPEDVSLRILKKLLDNANQPNVLERAKALTGQFSGLYRYRVGEYRIIFTLDNKRRLAVLTVLSVKH